MPPQRDYTPLISNQEGQDFVGRLIKEGEVKIGRNLFNPKMGECARVMYNLEEGSSVMIKIYDVAGNPIKTLFNGEIRGEEPDAIEWDGRDKNGDYVSPGLYFLYIDAGSFRVIKRIGVKRGD
jgi:flagellar hook assembly protein FlgD